MKLWKWTYSAKSAKEPKTAQKWPSILLFTNNFDPSNEPFRTGKNGLNITIPKILKICSFFDRRFERRSKRAYNSQNARISLGERKIFNNSLEKKVNKKCSEGGSSTTYSSSFITFSVFDIFWFFVPGSERIPVPNRFRDHADLESVRSRGPFGVGICSESGSVRIRE